MKSKTTVVERIVSILLALVLVALVSLCFIFSKGNSEEDYMLAKIEKYKEENGIVETEAEIVELKGWDTYIDTFGKNLAIGSSKLRKDENVVQTLDMYSQDVPFIWPLRQYQTTGKMHRALNVEKDEWFELRKYTPKDDPTYRKPYYVFVILVEKVYTSPGSDSYRFDYDIGYAIIEIRMGENTLDSSARIVKSVMVEKKEGYKINYNRSEIDDLIMMEMERIGAPLDKKPTSIG